MTANCSFCTHPLSKNEESNIKLFGKPVCNNKDCLAKANAEAQAAINTHAPDYIPLEMIPLLEGAGFTLQGWSAYKELGDSVEVRVDFKTLPLQVSARVGVMPWTEIAEKGELRHPKVQEELLKVQGFVKQCSKSGIPAPKSEPKVPEIVKDAKVQKPGAVLPVKTYTQQGCMIKGFVPQLKEIGKIKIGKKGALKESGGGKQFRQPVKFDHFEITNILKDDKTDDFLPDPIMKVLGEKPTELNILLLYNDITLNFRTRYNAYAGGKCVCAGDGETATTIEGELRVCNPEACETFQVKKCKVNGILSCILMKSPRLGGVYKFRTTSFHTVRSILSSLMFLSTITGGVLSMLPLKLVLSPMKVQPKNLQTTQTIYVVNVEFAGTAQELLQTMFEVQKYQGAMRAQILELEQTARLALNAPESDEESREVQDEFYPEEVK